MSRFIIKAVTVLLILTSTTTQALATDSVRVKLVKDFYEDLFSYNYKKALRRSPEMQYSDSFSALQKQLADACQKANQDGPCGYGSDFDVRIRSQESDESLTLKNSEFVASESKQGIIDVEFKLFPKTAPTKKVNFQISLIESREAWLVDDIIELKLKKKLMLWSLQKRNISFGFPLHNPLL